MRAAFRVDASASIGSGHLMRCLALAEALRHKNISSTFLCRAFPDHAGDVVLRHGFDLRLLPIGTQTALPPPPHATWLGASPEEDATACAAQLPNGTDILVVDHYALDAQWETAMRRFSTTQLVIDDLADRPHSCDVLLDQNLAPQMENRYAGLLPTTCRRLLGPSYALLNPSFAPAATVATERTTVRRLLLFFGGGDTDNLTCRALRELTSVDLPADVVIGSANPHRAEVEALCKSSNGRWTLHVQTSHMPERMLQADLALGTGGCSHWERCLLGLPALVVTTAANQVSATRMVAQSGACQNLGDVQSLTDGQFLQGVEKLLQNPQTLQAMSRAAKALMPDGNGAERVVSSLLEHKL